MIVAFRPSAFNDTGCSKTCLCQIITHRILFLLNLVTTSGIKSPACRQYGKLYMVEHIMSFSLSIIPSFIDTGAHPVYRQIIIWRRSGIELFQNNIRYHRDDLWNSSCCLDDLFL